jgi:hypothetical protein
MSKKPSKKSLATVKKKRLASIAVFFHDQQKDQEALQKNSLHHRKCQTY